MNHRADQLTLHYNLLSIQLWVSSSSIISLLPFLTRRIDLVTIGCAALFGSIVAPHAAPAILGIVGFGAAGPVAGMPSIAATACPWSLTTTQ